MYKYMLVIRTTDGETISLDGRNCHETKSVGGRIFHNSATQQVIVIGYDGVIYLFLDKDYGCVTNVSSTTVE